MWKGCPDPTPGSALGVNAQTPRLPRGCSDVTRSHVLSRSRSSNQPAEPEPAVPAHFLCSSMRVNRRFT